MGRPLFDIIINNTSVPVTQATYTAGNSVASAKLTAVLADPDDYKAFNTQINQAGFDSFHLKCKLGYQDPETGENATVTVMESRNVQAVNYKIHGDGEKFETTVDIEMSDHMGDWHTLSPRTEWIWSPKDTGAALEGGSLREFLRAIYVDRLGFDEVVTNLPNLIVPEIKFTPEKSFHSTVTELFSVFNPMIFEDATGEKGYQTADGSGGASITDLTNAGGEGLPTGGSLYIIAPQYNYTSSINARKIINTNYEDVSVSSHRRNILNQFDVKYRLDGNPSYFNFNPSSNSDPFGTRTRTTLDITGARGQSADKIRGNGTLISEVTPELIQKVDDNRNPYGEGTYIETTKYFLAWYDDPESPVPTQTVPTGSRVVHWNLTGGLFFNQKSLEAITEIYYLPGTDFKLSTGHRTTTNALVTLPGSGTSDKFFTRISDEFETIVFEQRAGDPPEQWRKVYTKQIKMGLVVFPERIELSDANANDSAETPNTTEQHADWDLISQRIEHITPTGSYQLKVTTTEWDNIKQTIRVSTTGDQLGREVLPTDKNQEHLARVTSKSLIRSFGARESTVVDCTIYRGYSGASGNQVNMGLTWGINQAALAMALSETPIRRIEFKSNKLLTNIKRGEVLTVRPKNFGRDHDSNIDLFGDINIIVDSVTFQVVNLANNNPQCSSVISGNELPFKVVDASGDLESDAFKDLELSIEYLY